MTDFQSLLRQPLDSGSHNGWDGKQCVMERVSMLWALATNQEISDAFSDLPECTNQVVARVAQLVNDRLSDDDRQYLNKFLPRLLRAHRTDSDLRVNARLAIWAARRVLDLVRPEDRAVCERAIEAAEAWLDDPSEEHAHNAYASASAADAASVAAYNAASASSAAYKSAAYNTYNAAYNAASASVAAYNAASASVAAYASDAAADAVSYAAYAAHADSLITFLDELLDEWESIVIKENEDLYTPQPWEDEALKFVAEYMA